VEHRADGAPEESPSNSAFAAIPDEDEIGADIDCGADDHFVRASFGDDDIEVLSGESGASAVARPSDARADDLVAVRRCAAT